MPEVAPEEQLRELLGQFGQRLELLYRRLPPFRVAGAERRCDHLLEQIVSPALRSRNPDRRQAGLDELQSLAELAQELSQLLFWRDLKQLADR